MVFFSFFFFFLIVRSLFFSLEVICLSSPNKLFGCVIHVESYEEGEEGGKKRNGHFGGGNQYEATVEIASYDLIWDPYL